MTQATALSPKPVRKSRLPQWLGFLDSDHFNEPVELVLARPRRTEWDRLISFGLMHVACVLVIWSGWSPVALITCIALYFIRMFAVTAIYHRYFAHRTYKTSRVVQFIFALWGLTAMQRGPLWWAAHHRHHHRNTDLPSDIHSPIQSGFWWSHMGWIASTPNMPTDYAKIRDFASFPELHWLNRFDWVMPFAFGIGVFAFGQVLAIYAPQLHTNGFQMLVWGFFISTVLLFHGTFTINSLAHTWGTRRYDTPDTSRNNAFLAFITLGEGWHNNHHYYQATVRQGFYWWEFDVAYYVLRGMEALGIVYDLKPVPAHVYASQKQAQVAKVSAHAAREKKVS